MTGRVFFNLAEYIDNCSLIAYQMLMCVSSCPQIPDILLAFTQPQIEDMQRNLGKIWHRHDCCGRSTTCTVIIQSSLLTVRAIHVAYPADPACSSECPNFQCADEWRRSRHRFVYGNIPLHDANLESSFQRNTEKRKAEAKEGAAWESLPAPYEGDLRRDDAWSTIMQWLYAKALETQAETDK